MSKVRPATANVDAAGQPDEGLVRALGLGSAVLFVVGSVIGSGIFLTTGVMAAALPSPALILLAWLTGGVIALSGGLTYAELGAMFPRSGGVYVYLREAFGPRLAFLYGWAALLIFFSGGIAAVAVGFAEYVSYFIPALSTSRVLWSVATPVGSWTLSAGQIVAVVSIAALAAINYVGVQEREPRQRRPDDREGDGPRGAADHGAASRRTPRRRGRPWCRRSRGRWRPSAWR